MPNFFRRLRRVKLPSVLTEAFLSLRAIPFIGSKYICPCCGWELRAFTAGDFSFKERDLSYCPRCNSKARHRRIWLFMKEHTNLFTDNLRLFEIAPKFSFARRFRTMRNIHYVAGDLQRHPEASLRMNLTATPLRSESFDALICVHVLEEIVEDHLAMDEMFRVLAPGGWAVITVPTEMDRLTYEDPTIVSPGERQRVFGEPAHVRIYGHDLVDRLRACGFEIKVDLANNVPVEKRTRYGLRNDENIFYCKKP